MKSWQIILIFLLFGVFNLLGGGIFAIIFGIVSFPFAVYHCCIYIKERKILEKERKILEEKEYKRMQDEAFESSQRFLINHRNVEEKKARKLKPLTFLQRLAKLQGFIMFLEEQNISVEEKLESLEEKCGKIMVKLSANKITDGTKTAPIKKQIQLLESFKYLAEKYLRHELNENERKLFEEGEWGKLGYEVTVDGVSLNPNSFLFDRLTIRSITEYRRQGSKETRRRVNVLEKNTKDLKIQFAKDKEQSEKRIDDLKEEHAQIRKELKIVEEWLKQGWQPHKEKYEERMKQQKQRSTDEISISKENSL